MAYRSTGLTTTQAVNILAGLTATGAASDPRVGGSVSRAVQVQNKLPLRLDVTIAGDLWSVAGSQSSTLPLPPDGTGLTWSMGNDTTVQQSGQLAFVWLLSSQLNPQPDGPLLVV